MRSTRLAVAQAAFFVVLSTAAGTPAPAQETPAEIAELELTGTPDTPVLRVLGAAGLEWSAALDASGVLALEFPDSVPGPAVGSISRERGLVAAVEIGFSVPNGRPTTTVSVIGRRAFRYEERTAAGALELVLSPAEGGGTVAPEVAGAEIPADDREELTRRLEAAEDREKTARNRVAELAAEVDRLRSEHESALAESERRRTEAAADLAMARGEGDERLARLESEVAAAVASRDRLRRELAQSRGRVAEVEAANAELLRANESSIESANQEASSARLLLARAPAILGVEEFVVADDVTPCLNLRASPARTGEIVDCLPAGTPFSVVDFAPDWLRGRLGDGREGWVAVDFVESRAERERSSERRRNEETAAALERVTTERDAAVARLTELKGVEARLLATQETLARITEERDAAQERLGESEESAGAVVAELEAALAAGKRNRSELEQRLEEADRERAELAARRNLAATELEQSQVRVAELEEALRLVGEQSASDQAELNQALARVAALERNRDELALRASAAELEPDELTTSPQPEEVAREPLLPTESDFVMLVEAWAAAWSEQRVGDYLFFYARAFRPSGGGSRSDWAELRRRRLEAPSFISVEVADLAVDIDGPERARVVFEQSYRSDSYQDRVRKSLELVREDGLWKILSEAVL